MRNLTIAFTVFALGCNAAPTVESRGSALTAEQCEYFAADGKVQVCHKTSSTRHPYQILKISDDACIDAHADHAGDYVAVNDPSCQGLGCLPAAAPCDDTLPCCEGTSCVEGTCQANGVCAGAPDGVACDDGDQCTGEGTCQGGVCQAGAPNCIAGASVDACTYQTGACSADIGECITSAITCPDDGNACTQDSCDPVLGCNAPVADGTACPLFGGTGLCSNGACAPPPPTVSQLAAGTFHTCALRTNGTVACWGSNSSGVLGNGGGEDSYTPVEVVNLTDAVQIDAGFSHTCAVRANGTVVCWGSNFTGQLGDGTFTGSSTPVQVVGLTDAIEVAAGEGHTCAVRSSGEVACWGSDDHGRLGNGGANVNSPTPVSVLSFTDATKITAGASHNCALRQVGGVACWGDGTYGQIGDGSNDVANPTMVAGLSDATEIEAGRFHNCAVHGVDGHVVCWGLNQLGQLGDGTTVNQNYANSGHEVSGTQGAVQVAAGGSHTCARLMDGTLDCWGSNSDGQLGDGTTTNRLTPVPVPSLGSVGEIAAGGNHTCARLTNGAVFCWGMNSTGQLGDGTTTGRLTPTLVTGL